MTCSAWSVTLSQAWPVSPASLISCPFVAAYAMNFGRVRTSQLRLRRPVSTGFATAAFSPRPLALPEIMGLRLWGAGQQTFKEQIPKYCTASNRNVCATSFSLVFSKTTYRGWKIARVFAHDTGELYSNHSVVCWHLYDCARHSHCRVISIQDRHGNG